MINPNTLFYKADIFSDFLDLVIDVPGYGQITVDIVYGGAFYAIVPAGRYGLDFRKSKVSDLRAAAGATTGNVVLQVAL